MYTVPTGVRISIVAVSFKDATILDDVYSADRR